MGSLSYARATRALATGDQDPRRELAGAFEGGDCDEGVLGLEEVSEERVGDEDGVSAEGGCL